jgi:hypothetical protein
MNWYLLNIPPAVAILAALVAPIFVVISREHCAEEPTDLAAVPLRPAKGGSAAVLATDRTGHLELVS